MFVSSPAIVLSRIKHSDSTLIVTLYTEQMGTVPFAVRIPKTSKAGIKPALFQPLNILEVEWDHRAGTGIQRLRNTHVLHPYATLNYTPEKATIATFLAETVYYAMKEEHQGDMFQMLQNSFLWLDNASEGYEDFPVVFLIKLARFLGFEPSIENCSDYAYFDLINAEYVPLQPPHNYYLRQADARHIPRFLDLQYHNAHTLRLDREQRLRALNIVLTYLRLHIPGVPKLQSLDILRQIY